MAKEHQLDLLKNDLSRWNIWRTPFNMYAASLLEEIDLQNADLHGAILVEVELQAANLHKANLRDANLRDANLIQADLRGADLRNVNLRGAKLTQANLSGANLSGADLRGANLGNANLTSAFLYGANLTGTNLNQANLKQARLNNASLRQASLRNCELEEANLNEVDLSEADLRESSLFRASLIKVNAAKADFRGARLFTASLEHTDLSDADLSRTDLRSANLSGAKLVRTILAESTMLYAIVGNTFFGDLDLSEVNRLETVNHDGPSIISIDTIAKSKGKIPEAFLKGCGLSNWEIQEAKLYDPSLSNDEVTNILYEIYPLRATQAIQISPLFISYTHLDTAFVDRLDGKLEEKGVRFWRDTRDLRAGRIGKQIDQALRQNPTVLLVLSKNALRSDWVEHEVRTARWLEKELERDVLCPVALDNSWKSGFWPARLMEQIMEYNILDFSEWQDDVKFERMFRKLIDGLELFYKG